MNKPPLVCPPLAQHHLLRQPLRQGEVKVRDLLISGLQAPWEIYVQPHMNGLCPDFVVLNPQVGIVIIEVKGTNLNAMEYRWSYNEIEPVLVARRHGSHNWFRPENPFSKVDLYKSELLDLYCPRLGKQFSGAHNAPAVSTVLVFSQATRQQVDAIANPYYQSKNITPTSQRDYKVVLSAEDIEGRDIFRLVPQSRRTYSNFMKEELAADLRAWLVEPDYKAAQRIPMVLDDDQLKLAQNQRKTKISRLRGAAGAGKSQVIAARAAYQALNNRTVLVCSYNITLVNYLRDLVVQGVLKFADHRYVKKALDNITFVNFHAWAKRICVSNGYEKEYLALFHGDSRVALDEGMALLVKKILQGVIAEERCCADVILVDEGQDFRIIWWQALRGFLSPEGEMLLAADKTQDLYGTASAWTDEAMNDCGFRGQWATLKRSYRLPPDMVPHVNRFAERFLEKPLILTEQGIFDYGSLVLKWVSTTPELLRSRCVDEIKNFPVPLPGQAYSDIVFLAPNNSLGLDVVSRLGQLGMKCGHTFSCQDKNTPDNESQPSNKQNRRLKMAFYLGAEKIKATTVHSFKGWESKSLVLCIDNQVNRNKKALIYTALTRLRQAVSGINAIVVVCADPAFDEYGRTWPQFEVHQ